MSADHGQPVTTEGNKIIAEFMGHKVSYGLQGAMLITTEEISYTPAKYHSSWDWIMPVCKKLDCLADDGIIQFSGAYKELSDDLDDAVTRFYDIEPVWQAVVQFIQWYNQNKQQ